MDSEVELLFMCGSQSGGSYFIVCAAFHLDSFAKEDALELFVWLLQPRVQLVYILPKLVYHLGGSYETANT